MPDIKFDASVFAKMFDGFDAAVSREISSALHDEAKRVLDDAYSYSGISMEDALTGIRMRIPDMIDALPMRKNADGVFVLDKRENSYVSAADCDTFIGGRRGGKR